MKVLPIALSVNKSNYSYNSHKNNFTDNVAFSGRAQIIKADAIKRVDINDIMLSSSVLAENFKALIQRENVLRQDVDNICCTLTERIGNILTENGFSPQHFILHGKFRGVTVKEPQHFFELFKKLDGETVIVDRPGWGFHKWAQAMFADNPDDVLTHVEHRLKLKSKKYPDASLEIYAANIRNNYDNIVKDTYLLDINSYKDKEFELLSKDHHYNFSGCNFYTLNSSEIKTTGQLKNWDFCLYSNGFPILDKDNNTTYWYTNNILSKIESGNDNKTYDLFDKTITQNFQDKVVIHHLSKNLNSTESIEFRKVEQNKY